MNKLKDLLNNFMLLTTSSFTICEDEGANRKKEQKKKSNFFSSFNGLLDPNKMVIKVEWKTFFIQELEMHNGIWLEEDFVSYIFLCNLICIIL